MCIDISPFSKAFHLPKHVKGEKSRTLDHSYTYSISTLEFSGQWWKKGVLEDGSHHPVPHGALHLNHLTPSYLHDSSPSASSSSESLLHLALFLTPPSKTWFLNIRDPLFVLGTEFLHASTLQELLLLLFLALLQDLLLSLQLRADRATAGRLLQSCRPLKVWALGVETSPTTATTATWKTDDTETGIKGKEYYLYILRGHVEVKKQPLLSIMAI